MRPILRLIALGITALLIGIVSARLSLEGSFAVGRVQLGPWVIWPDAADPEGDPYTKSKTARSGRLLISGTSARYYQAAEDSDGRRLWASCEYVVEGRAMDALWWSLAVYDDNGGLFQNKAGRHAFNSTNIFLREDETFTVALSRNARPGNWLPVAGDDVFQLILRIHWPAVSEGATGTLLLDLGLPTITRVGCE